MDENGQLLHIDSVEHNGTNSTQPMRIDEDKVVSTNAVDLSIGKSYNQA
jgi:hypothetical protein